LDCAGLVEIARLGCPPGQKPRFLPGAPSPALNEARAADSVEIAAGDFNP
jgi:hypothetical protein